MNQYQLINLTKDVVIQAPSEAVALTIFNAAYTDQLGDPPSVLDITGDYDYSSGIAENAILPLGGFTLEPALTGIIA